MELSRKSADPAAPPVAAELSSTPAAGPAPAAIPAFFINRDCDTARLDSVGAYLRAAELAAERVRAVEGLDVPAHLRPYFFEGNRLRSKLKPGEVGCYASHLVAMELIVQRNLEYALILEDDAAIPHDIAASLADVLANMPAGWDIVHISRDSNRAVKIVADLADDRRLVRYSRVPETTTGYLISRSGAQKFLKPSKRYWPIDTDFRRPWCFGLEIYGVTSPIVHPAGFDSSIHKIGNHSRLRRGIPIPSWHCWTGNPLHTPESIAFNLRTLGALTWTICATHNATRRVVSLLGLRPAIRRLGLAEISARVASSLAVR